MDDKEKSLECCFEDGDKLVFDPGYRDIYLFEKSSDELKSIFSIIPECDIVVLETEDYSAAQGIKFKDGAKVNLGGVEGLPPDLDISNCSEVDMSGRDLSAIPPQVMREGSTFIYAHHSQSGLEFSRVCPFENVDISHCQQVIITNNNLSNVSDLKFCAGADVCLAGCTNIPQNLDVSGCSKIDLSSCDLGNIKRLQFKEGASVDLSGCTNIPKDLDFSHCDEVNLSGCDLNQIEKIKFKERAKINLSGCTNIPKDLDFSHCDEVNLSGCDLNQIEKIKFKEGAKINLSGCTNIPRDLDFSHCDEVNLSGCDLNQIEKIKFKERAKINLSGCTNIPRDLDVSRCRYVNLSKCDLSNVDTLEFSEWSKVNLSKSKLPDNTDFSLCYELSLADCNLTRVKNIKFRNEASVNLQGAELPGEIEASNCKEVWLVPQQFKKVVTGDASVVVGGIGAYDEIDFSSLRNFTVPGITSHEILGNSYTSFLGSKLFIFRDETQYQEFLKNNTNIAVPEGCNISFSKKNVAEIMKEDQRKARAIQKSRRNLLSKKRNNEHTSPKEKSGIVSQNAIENKKQPDYHKPHVEPSISTYAKKPLIIDIINKRRISNSRK